jgi:hypothetical protein
VKNFSEAEQKGVNLMPVSELDEQIMSGNWCPLCINDGRVIGMEDEDRK